MRTVIVTWLATAERVKSHVKIGAEKRKSVRVSERDSRYPYCIGIRSVAGRDGLVLSGECPDEMMRSDESDQPPLARDSRPVNTRSGTICWSRGGGGPHIHLYVVEYEGGYWKDSKASKVALSITTNCQPSVPTSAETGNQRIFRNSASSDSWECPRWQAALVCGVMDGAPYQ